MYAFKIVTTVFLSLIIATMALMLINKRNNIKNDEVIVTSIITVIQIMAIASIWL